MELIIVLAIGAFWAVIGSNMAATRGRNTTAWAIAGFLVGLFAIIPLAIIGKTAEKKAEDEAAQAQRVAALIKNS